MLIKRLAERVLVALDYLEDVLLLLLRGYWGYQFHVTGWGKLQNIERVSGYFASLGIPLPTFNAYMAGGTECFGGLLLLAGLFARPAGLFLAGTMSVAYLTAHRDVLVTIFSRPDAFVAADPFLFLVVALLVLVHGPGMISVDALLVRIFRDRLERDAIVLGLWAGRSVARRVAPAKSE